MDWHLDVLYLYLSIALHQHVQTVSGQLSRISDSEACVCPGDIVNYQCTINGSYGGSTIFRAKPSSFIGCTREFTDIILPHSQFNQSQHGVNISCNNKTVIGQSLSADHGIYSSQLNITVTSQLIGDTIECFHDDGIQSTLLVGESPIYNAALYSPTKLYLINIDLRLNQVTLNWNSFAPDCPAIHYIVASNCGSCPTTTNHTNVTCTDVPTDGILCIFSVESVMCENIYQKDTLNITLTNGSAIMEKDLLAALISTDIILLLIIISLLCYIILITRRKRSKASSSASLQMPNTYYSTRHEKNASYEDVMKVFDNQSMGTYGPLEYEEPVKTKGLMINTAKEQPLDLDHLLINLKDELNSQWYTYGLAIGVPKDFLEKLKEHSKGDCLTEVLDYWLCHHPGQPTWSEVIEAQKKIEFQFNSAKKKS